MPILIVVNNPRDWPLVLPGVEILSAKTYLTESRFTDLRQTRVFNLCKSYKYQSMGYYVSLLASARGHKPLPSIATIQDMKTTGMIRMVSEDLDELIQSSLKPILSDRFTLSIYFGKNMASRYDRLSLHLFNLFQAPLLRADFIREDGEWSIRTIRPIPYNDIPENHREFVISAATHYFTHNGISLPRKNVYRYDMAILTNEKELCPPSDPKALNRFAKAARRHGMNVEFIEKEDIGRVPQFDALFIRETTQVNHHTYSFARRAVAEGLVVIDDPDSIARCSNKVYLAELLDRYEIPVPKTMIVHRGNTEQIISRVGLPCILKKPDSSFSMGVFKAENEDSLKHHLNLLLSQSDLIIAQEFLPTDFDWRVGILNRTPLYVCRYYMARKHWQIQRTDTVGKTHYGKVDTLRVEDAPTKVVKTALRAANLIGDGLYGVDLKQIGKKIYVIEVNDNPSIEAGVEDRVLKSTLYDRIMQTFLDRIESRNRQGS